MAVLHLSLSDHLAQICTSLQASFYQIHLVCVSKLTTQRSIWLQNFNKTYFISLFGCPPVSDVWGCRPVFSPLHATALLSVKNR